MKPLAQTRKSIFREEKYTEGMLTFDLGLSSTKTHGSKNNHLHSQLAANFLCRPIRA